MSRRTILLFKITNVEIIIIVLNVRDEYSKYTINNDNALRENMRFLNCCVRFSFQNAITTDLNIRSRVCCTVYNACCVNTYYI